MTAKRAVPHRSQPFDSLLLEWQKASRLGKEREALTKNLGGTNNPMMMAAAAQQQQQLQQQGMGVGVGMGQLPGMNQDGSIGMGDAAGGGGKKDKKKKNQLNATSSSAFPAIPGLDPNSPGSSLLQPNNLFPNTPGSATTGGSKKSKKPNGSNSNSANSSAIYYVGEAPPASSNTQEGRNTLYEGEEEEESDYLSSSDEVESVLLSLQKLTKRTTSTASTASPLVMREGGGSGFSNASWFTGRNRKLMRLRNLGLDSVFGGGNGGTGPGGNPGMGNAKR